jgi:hypothetical protein
MVGIADYEQLGETLTRMELTTVGIADYEQLGEMLTRMELTIR